MSGQPYNEILQQIISIVKNTIELLSTAITCEIKGSEQVYS